MSTEEIIDQILDEEVEAYKKKVESRKHEIIRGESGKFAKGHTGNPFGHPPGTISLVLLLKRHFKKHPEDAQAIVDALVNLGKAGDMRAIEQLIDRIDGRVVERHAIEGEMPVLIQFIPAQRLIENPTKVIESPPPYLIGTEQDD